MQLSDPAEFKGKVAVVTGSKQGIGQAVVKALRKAEAIVAELDILFDENKNNLQYQVDIADSFAVDRLIEHIEATVGEIGFLVNVAGILRMAPLLECSLEDWQRTFAVNTTGAFNVCRAVARKMMPRRQGAIVVVGSNAADIPRMGMGSYAASKAATKQMIRCLGLELAAANIRCNVVAPGSTDTHMQRQLWKDKLGELAAVEGDLTSFRLGIPLGRIAQPDNIADVVMFLLSSSSSHITLESITVDGGATLGA